MQRCEGPPKTRMAQRQALIGRGRDEDTKTHACAMRRCMREGAAKTKSEIPAEGPL